MSMSVLEAPFRLPEAPARSDLVAKYFRGLGDATRVRILELLRDEGELSVGELVERLALPQPKVSNHLACLRWCGFIEARREHRTVYNRSRAARGGLLLRRLSEPPSGDRTGRAGQPRTWDRSGAAVGQRARPASGATSALPRLADDPHRWHRRRPAYA